MPEDSIIRVRDLHKSYGSFDVVRGISLSCAPSEVISVIGASGSGKSTFLRCINLLEIPEKGEIEINGTRLPLSSPGPNRKATDTRLLSDIRSNIGMVFQSFNLWSHRTIIENIIEGPVQVKKVSRAEAIENAHSLLNRVGLAEKANSYPAELSGGQQQRAAIARTLAMDPKIILFDEPTSALDPEMVGEVLLVIRQLAEEDSRAMLVVTHEMGFAKEVSDQVIFIHEGKIGEQGSPDQLFNHTETESCRRFLSKVI